MPGLSISGYIADIDVGKPRRSSPIKNALLAIQAWQSAGLVDADINAAAAIAISKLGVTGTLSGDVLHAGSNLSRYAVKAIVAQAQSVTTTMFTISGIANGDAGVIHASYGGNINTISRESNNVDISFFRTGGTVFLLTAGYGSTGAGHMAIGSANSGGDIVISAITDAFGAGSFVGVFEIEVFKSTTGLVIT